MPSMDITKTEKESHGTYQYTNYKLINSKNSSHSDTSVDTCTYCYKMYSKSCSANWLIFFISKNIYNRVVHDIVESIKKHVHR